MYTKWFCYVNLQILLRFSILKFYLWCVICVRPSQQNLKQVPNIFVWMSPYPQWSPSRDQHFLGGNSIGNNIPTFFTPLPMRVIIVSDLMSDFKQEPFETLWPKRVNRNVYSQRQQPEPSSWTSSQTILSVLISIGRYF